jgi:hypothetical protein
MPGLCTSASVKCGPKEGTVNKQIGRLPALAECGVSLTALQIGHRRNAFEVTVSYCGKASRFHVTDGVEHAARRCALPVFLIAPYSEMPLAGDLVIELGERIYKKVVLRLARAIVDARELKTRAPSSAWSLRSGEELSEMSNF